MDIESRVFLLAIYKKKPDESIKDVMFILENTKLFSLKDGKKKLKELKEQEYVDENSLTLKGIELAKQVELEFKI